MLTGNQITKQNKVRTTKQALHNVSSDDLTCGALQLCDPAQQPGVNVGDGDAGQAGDVGEREGGGDGNAETSWSLLLSHHYT